MSLEKIINDSWTGNFVRSAVIASQLFLCTNNVGCTNQLKLPKAQAQQLTTPELNNEELQFCKGVNYVSWARGDYPFTTSWKVQTYNTSQAIVRADITNTKPFRGNGSLELDLNVVANSETHREGEVLADLRYIPNYDAINPVRIERDTNNNPLGVDLAGKTIGAVVFCEKEIAGKFSSLSGLQIFLKSVRVINNREVWSSYYGNWHNIWPREMHGSSAYPELGDVVEEEWSLVSVKVPNKIIAQPQYGYADADFDPHNVALIGLKYGVNRSNHYSEVSGKIWVDEFSWKNIINNGDADFDFWKLRHSLDVDVWNYFRTCEVSPLSFEEGMLFKDKYTFSSVGNNVIFEFEDVQDPVISLRDNGYNIAAIVQTEYMNNSRSNNIHPDQQKSHTDDELIALMQDMNSKGIRIMFKPHIDVADGSWRGSITPEDMQEWFISYTKFILHYAEIAEQYSVEVLVIGTELKSVSGSDYRQEWEEVIRKVKEVYSGKLTYAANWDEYKSVCLLDLVDIIGIDAYFPIRPERNPSLNELVSGWSKWVEELSEFQKQIKKDIIFTEIGYRSTDYAAKEPWEYKEERPINQELQVNCYKAVMEAFRDKPWFKGAIFWNWMPKKDYGGKFNTDFTPQNKLAEGVFK